MTIKEFYRNFIEQLQTIYSADESTKITEMVFEKIASVKKSDIIISPSLILNDAVTKELSDALNQLLQHKPIQYILGEAWFCNMRFKVNEHVLIPRPETEELVELAIYDVRFTMYDVGNDENNMVNRTSKIVHMLDIGTGSGCIAITLKKKLPDADVTAIDLSEGALDIARENALSNEVVIHFLQVDFLDESKWIDLPSFNIIVSNPPYIPNKEKEILDKNVTAYEPDTALFVPDNTPVIFYEKIAAFAKTHLNANGKIFVEIHEDFSEETAKAFSKYFTTVEIKKDIFGKDRMITATQFR